jgi:phospholipid transport system substrate-binding protein
MTLPRFVLALVAIVLAVLGHARPGAAGEATEQLRTHIDALSRSVATATPPGGAPAAASRAIADRLFDWNAMARASLRDHWDRRAPAEREEFTRLFADVFARAYLSRIHLVDSKAFEYFGDTTSGEWGLVKTKVFTKKGTAIAVDYVVRTTAPRRWQVQDVRVEAISLVDNYRAQFDTIVSRSSYDDLVAKLRVAMK